MIKTEFQSEEITMQDYYAVIFGVFNMASFLLILAIFSSWVVACIIKNKLVIFPQSKNRLNIFLINSFLFLMTNTLQAGAFGLFMSLFNSGMTIILKVVLLVSPRNIVGTQSLLQAFLQFFSNSTAMYDFTFPDLYILILNVLFYIALVNLLKGYDVVAKSSVLKSATTSIFLSLLIQCLVTNVTKASSYFSILRFLGPFYLQFVVYFGPNLISELLYKSEISLGSINFNIKK